MKRILTPIRLFAVALLALLALSIPSLSAHAGSVQCDKTMLNEANKEAVAAVGYMNYLDQSYNSSALTKAIKEEKKVIANTTNCNHLKTAFDNAFKADNDYYNFYFNVVPANAHTNYTESAHKHIVNAFNLVETVYGTSQP